ncbi:MAG: aspartate carbamoyltransferase [Armatimonadetes bacterium CG_4_10_14_3_um_filter_66_18]|nr:aspartate carbamoyltransferase catalytic subunit [Armatimonadota bacterium]OIO96494.1 MAG: aspartate carbamoyltransferase [Armatimonadetes bacterium CG2_30_66_41]PIU94095.1 MAG: aspartate carbamoyltransferase [Armatimonadetes bacterium CG06_land_8_20_14_3_00_66_21]PIX46255.1 MAG: aspartate carbamoyltransferase [Armatimonadetes bacterium CG_4_8_14_3_um_filter_66_20]PIY40620.1 MAG: aspartate carbamoyltransferase [Armatimonadetes bacterium CG_4_10_14_3_um_filter_66_18]PIZ41516.1 MAG: aspartate
MNLNRKDVIALQDMSAEEINLCLDTADSMRDVLKRPVPKVPALQGKRVVTLFYEPSTRTRTSFEAAAKALSADVVNITTSASSIVKGETLKDTIYNLKAIGMDALIMRHPMGGAPNWAARVFTGSVLNAGDGMHEHPSQGLLDLLTIRQHKGRIDGMKVAIIGDIRHSRVARSDAWGMTKLGAEVRFVGPPTLMPVEVEKMGVKVTPDLREGIDGVDVVYTLRIQLERQQGGLFPSIREYAELFGMNSERMKWAADDALLMHPGPINRGIELSSELADSPRSVILDQVTNGVAVRMALLFLLLTGPDHALPEPEVN